MKARVRELRLAIPFCPFVIRMADGQAYRVDDLDFVFASPSNLPRVIVEEPGSGRCHHLSPSLMVGVDEITDASHSV